MLPILAFCTLFILVATLLPLSKHSHWIVRGMDFPRLQLSILAIALLIAQVLFLDFQSLFTWVLVLATGLCLLWQLWWILPYTPVWSSEVAASSDGDRKRQLSILTSNVLTPNRNAIGLIELVKEHQPDIVVTLESDQWWEDQLRVLEKDMPHCVKCPLDNLYGMHVFSKLPLVESEISFLVEDDVPSIHALVKLRCGDIVRVHFIHPAPPSPTENEESTERDAELLVVARSVAECEKPVIVSGDLNDVAWSSTTRLFRKVSGLLDPRVGRGMFNTFHADYPIMRWPLDHVFHSQHFTLQRIQRLPSIGSDHFPLFCTLTFSPAHNNNQEGLEADSSDEERAKELTEEEQVSKSKVPFADFT